MQIKVGTINCDTRLLDKRTLFNSSNPTTINVQIFNDCEIKNPKFLLDHSAIPAGANYAYVQSWGLYYFLHEPDIIDGARCVVAGIVDPLTSYADDIKLLSAYLTRTEDSAHNNKYVNDNLKPVQNNGFCRTLKFNKTPFKANYAQDIVYLLTVIGGNHTPTTP